MMTQTAPLFVYKLSKLWPLKRFKLYVAVASLSLWLLGLGSLVAQNAEAFYQQGIQAIAAKDYKTAKSALFKSLQLKADYPEAFIALGAVFEAFGDDDTASKSYVRAIKLNKRAFDAYFGYAGIAMKGNKLKLAWQVYSRIVKLDPKNAKGYTLRGNLLLPYVPFLALLDYDQAIINTSDKAELAKLYLSRGNANLAQWRWKDAENDYTKAIELNPESGLAYVGLGRSQLRQQEYLKAKESFVKAQHYESDNPYVYAGLAASEAADETVKSKEKIIQKYFDEAFTRNSKIPELYWRRAQFKRLFGQFKEAEEDYNKAVELGPKDFEVYQLRGSFFQWLGRYQEALSDYNKGVTLINANLLKTRKGEKLDETEILRLLQYRGDVRVLVEQYDAALKDYQILLRRKVENPDVYIGIGNVQIAKGQDREALASYEKAVSLAPTEGLGSAKPRYLQGSAKAQLGEFDAGLADIEQAIKLEPRNASAYYYQGLVYAKLNDYVKARASMENALHYSPYDPKYSYSMALILDHLTHYREALEQLALLGKLNPSYDKLYSLRAKIYLHQKLFDQAMASIDKGLQVNPQNVELYILQADVYDGQGKGDLALEVYHRGLESVPDSIELYRSRALFYQKLKQPELALTDIDKAIALDPKDVENLLAKSLLLSLNHRVEEAATILDEALKLDATSYDLRLDLRLQRANLEIWLGRYQDAETDILEALKVDSRNPLALYMRGRLALLMGDYQVAETNTNEAYHSNTSNPLFIFNYAQALVANGQIGKATGLFKQLLKSKENSAKGRYGEAIIALYKEQYKKAINLFNTAINQEPEPEPMAYIGRGRTFLKLLDYASALNDFQYYVDHYDNNYQAWRFLGEAQRNLGNLKEADEAYQKALDYNPKDAESYYGQGMVLLSNQDLSQALTNFEKAIQLDDKQAPFYLGRAAVKLAEGDPEAALTDSQLALHYDETLADAYKLQVDIYTKLGDESNATKAQNQYKKLSK